MKIRKVKKSAATMGLAVVISLVGFALGLAQDSSPVVAGYSFGLYHSFPVKASSHDDSALRVWLVPKTGQTSVSFQRMAHELTVVYSPSAVNSRLVDFAGAKSRKIALHLIDSVLLI